MTHKDRSLAHSATQALKRESGENKVFTKYFGLIDTHRHSETGLRNLRGQLLCDSRLCIKCLSRKTLCTALFVALLCALLVVAIVTASIFSLWLLA